MVKIGRIQTCQIFGRADGPRVRGGRFAVHEKCSPEALQKGFWLKVIVADGPPRDRGRSAGSSVHPVSFGYAGGVSSEQGADGPPMVRGQSAGVEKN